MKKLIPIVAVLAGFIGAYRLYAAFFSKPYGDVYKIGKHHIYYQNKISRSEAEQTGAFLKRNDFYVDGQQKDLQLDKAGDTVLVKMIVDREKFTAENKGAFVALTGLFSDSVFTGKPVNILVCNDQFEPYQTIHYSPQQVVEEEKTAGDLQEKKFNGSSLFYSAALKEEEVQKLGNYLVSSGFFGADKLEVIAGKEHGMYNLSYVIKPEALTPENKQLIAQFAFEVKQAVFNGAPFSIRLCDDKFNVLGQLPKTQ